MIGHRCFDHVIHPDTETLIVGTFNPATDSNYADFFYGRPQNHLWSILGSIYGKSDIKECTKTEKIAFAHANRFDFVDLIAEIDVEPPDYKDDHLERIAKAGQLRWRDLSRDVDALPHLKCLAVSRKHFNTVPTIGAQVDQLRVHLSKRPVRFRCLHSPTRAPRRALAEWTDFLQFDRRLESADAL